MGYFKAILNVQNNHNKKHKFLRLTGRLHYLHNWRLTSTTLRVYHTEIGANSVYKERADQTCKVSLTDFSRYRSCCKSMLNFAADCNLDHFLSHKSVFLRKCDRLYCLVALSMVETLYTHNVIYIHIHTAYTQQGTQSCKTITTYPLSNETQNPRMRVFK
eukprot:6267228-Amphidinium_carterae.1